MIINSDGFNGLDGLNGNGLVCVLVWSLISTRLGLFGSSIKNGLLVIGLIGYNRAGLVSV